MGVGGDGFLLIDFIFEPFVEIQSGFGLNVGLNYVYVTWTRNISFVMCRMYCGFIRTHSNNFISFVQTYSFHPKS